jgi:hypothetical protein
MGARLFVAGVARKIVRRWREAGGEKSRALKDRWFWLKFWDIANVGVCSHTVIEGVSRYYFVLCCRGVCGMNVLQSKRSTFEILSSGC